MEKLRNAIPAILLALALMLTGCGGSTGEDTTAAPETTEATAEASAETTVPSATEAAGSPEMELSAAQPGYYLISSVGENGDVTFFGAPDPANGYLKLEEDHTGVLRYGDVEQTLTWDGEMIYWGEETLPYVYMCYYDEELGRDDSMLVVYFVDDMISLVFRPGETE